MKDFNVVITIGVYAKDSDEALGNVEHIIEVVRNNIAGENYNVDVVEVGIIE